MTIKQNSEIKIDTEKVKEATRLLLEAIGEDLSRPGLIETPDRIANMYTELFSGINEDASDHLQRTFVVDNNSIVIEKDIYFYSMCEHHLLPFFGKAHIGYVPNGKVAGLSKLARTVEVFARRLQLQEQMTSQITKAIEEHLNPKGVIVYLEAEHLCMTMRGVKKPGSKTVSMIATGVFKDDPMLLSSFMHAIGKA